MHACMDVFFLSFSFIFLSPANSFRVFVLKIAPAEKNMTEHFLSVFRSTRAEIFKPKKKKIDLDVDCVGTMQ